MRYAKERHPHALNSVVMSGGGGGGVAGGGGGIMSWFDGGAEEDEALAGLSLRDRPVAAALARQQRHRLRRGSAMLGINAIAIAVNLVVAVRAVNLWMLVERNKVGGGSAVHWRSPNPSFCARPTIRRYCLPSPPLTGRRLDSTGCPPRGDHHRRSAVAQSRDCTFPTRRRRSRPRFGQDCHRNRRWRGWICCRGHRQCGRSTGRRISRAPPIASRQRRRARRARIGARGSSCNAAGCHSQRPRLDDGRDPPQAGA